MLCRKGLRRQFASALAREQETASTWQERSRFPEPPVADQTHPGAPRCRARMCHVPSAEFLTPWDSLFAAKHWKSGVPIRQPSGNRRRGFPLVLWLFAVEGRQPAWQPSVDYLTPA